MAQHYLARQPILDETNTIHAYEILFRQSQGMNRMITDHDAVNELLIRNTLGTYTREDLLGTHLGFINVDHTFFLRNYGTLFPKKNFIFEILGSTQVTPELIACIASLHSEGHVFALSEFVFEEWYIKNFSPLFRYVSYIKVDLRKNSMQRIKLLAANFQKKLGCKMVAEKVESIQEFAACKQIGFHYFQGYFFAQPQLLSKETVDPSLTKVLNIIAMLNSDDTDTGAIVKIFEQSPELSLSLVNFMNSGAFGLRQAIRSIQHALTLLGRKKLVSWLTVIACSATPNGKRHPALITALVRAKIMESLMEMYEDGKYRNTADSAFFVGMLSLVDVILNVPKAQVLENIKAHEKICQAVLQGEGTLGLMLQAIIFYEKEDFAAADGIMENLLIPAKALNEIVLKSYIWADAILAS